MSLVRSAPVALRGEDPILEANAYALAEAVDLTVVLAGAAVELALASGFGDRDDPLQPPASQEDLRGLLESGVAVFADADDLALLGVGAGDLVPGVRVLSAEEIAAVLGGAEAVLSW